MGFPAQPLPPGPQSPPGCPLSGHYDATCLVMWKPGRRLQPVPGPRSGTIGCLTVLSHTQVESGHRYQNPTQTQGMEPALQLASKRQYEEPWGSVAKGHRDSPWPCDSGRDLRTRLWVSEDPKSSPLKSPQKDDGQGLHHTVERDWNKSGPNSSWGASMDGPSLQAPHSSGPRHHLSSANTDSAIVLGFRGREV